MLQRLNLSFVHQTRKQDRKYPNQVLGADQQDESMFLADLSVTYQREGKVCHTSLKTDVN